MNFQDLLSTEIIDGKTLSDFLTLDFLASVVGSVLAAIAILVVGFFLAGWAKRRITRMADNHARLDPTLMSFLASVVRYAILAFTFLFVLNTFGVQTTSIVAVIGAAGLAVGLALQGTLSNIAAGVMIIFFRPIKEGDFVEINGQMGTVKEITLNFTELATIGNVQVIIPNSEVWGNTIVNYSVYDRRRAEWTFGVGYGVNLAAAERVIRDVVMSDERTDTSEDLWLQVNNLGDFSVDFLCRAWVSADDYFAYQADIKRKVKEALDENDLDIPFPTRTVMIERDGDDAPDHGASRDTREGEVRQPEDEAQTREG